jgi:stearoyl-CoA desaturase (delta-9 desaturase)
LELLVSLTHKRPSPSATPHNEPHTHAHVPAIRPAHPEVHYAPKPVLSPEEKAAREAAERAELKQHRYDQGIDWAPVLWISALHLGALAAPFCFTWVGLGVFVALWWLTGCIGICLGFHRLLTHTGFNTYKPVRWTLAFIGQLAGEGSAIYWVAQHRKHHALSDKPGDPHSPLDGAWWAHMFWLTPGATRDARQELFSHWAPDLFRDPVLRFLDKTFIVWHLLLGAGLYAVGYYVWDVPTAISLLVWGSFLRMVFVLHVTWFVNSASHIWGYRNYTTTDESRNLWWVAMLAFGEGWHNNHHAYPRMAMHGHRWWEFDLTYNMIRIMRATGLVWNVADEVPTTKPR